MTDERIEHCHFMQARQILDELLSKVGQKPVQLNGFEKHDMQVGFACSDSYHRQIYISRATLDTLDHTDVIVKAILAHELGHIALKHGYWVNLIGSSLFYGLLPSAALLWWVSKSLLAGLIIPATVYFLYGLVVQIRAESVLAAHDEDANEQAAHRYGAEIAGEELYSQYREAMKSHQALKNCFNENNL